MFRCSFDFNLIPDACSQAPFCTTLNHATRFALKNQKERWARDDEYAIRIPLDLLGVDQFTIKYMLQLWYYASFGSDCVPWIDLCVLHLDTTTEAAKAHLLIWCVMDLMVEAIPKSLCASGSARVYTKWWLDGGLMRVQDELDFSLLIVNFTSFCVSSKVW